MEGAPPLPCLLNTHCFKHNLIHCRASCASQAPAFPFSQHLDSGPPGSPLALIHGGTRKSASATGSSWEVPLCSVCIPHPPSPGYSSRSRNTAEQTALSLVDPHCVSTLEGPAEWVPEAPSSLPGLYMQQGCVQECCSPGKGKVSTSLCRVPVQVLTAHPQLGRHGRGAPLCYCHLHSYGHPYFSGLGLWLTAAGGHRAGK